MSSYAQPGSSAGAPPPAKRAAAAPPKRSLLDVAGYVAAAGYGDEAWRIAYTCRLGYCGDGSETAQLLLRALATRVTSVKPHWRLKDEISARSRLSHAARRGHVARIHTLIRAGADVRGADGVRALCEATRFGCVAAAAALLQAGADPDGVTTRIHYVYDALSNTQPWHHMSSSHMHELVPLLLEAGGGRFLLTGAGDACPLRVALEAHYYCGWHYISSSAGVLRQLLPLYDAPEHEGDLAHAVAAAVVSGRLPELKLLLDTGAVDAASPALHGRMYKVDPASASFQCLLAHGASARVLSESSYDTFSGPAVAAYHDNGDDSLLRMMVEAEFWPAAVLKDAVRAGWAAGVPTLLARLGAYPITWSLRGVLHCLDGTVAECEEILRLLLNVGFGSKLEHRAGKQHRTPLLSACAEHRVNAAIALVRRGANVRATEGAELGGVTALHLLAASDADAESAAVLVPLLVAGGLNVNARDANGFTPLYWCAEHGGAGAVAALVAAGADTASSGRRSKPLMEVARQKAARCSSRPAEAARFAAVVAALAAAGVTTERAPTGKK
jgi:ankyrin repeat protein